MKAVYLHNKSDEYDRLGITIPVELAVQDSVFHPVRKRAPDGWRVKREILMAWRRTDP